MNRKPISPTNTRQALEQLLTATDANPLTRSAYQQARKALIGSIKSPAGLRAAFLNAEFLGGIGSFLALDALLDPRLLNLTKNDSARVAMNAHPLGRQLVAMAMGLQVSRGKWEEQISNRVRRRNWPLSNDEVENSVPAIFSTFVTLRLPNTNGFDSHAVWRDVGITHDSAAALSALGCPLAKELCYRHLVLSLSPNAGANPKETAALRAIAKVAATGVAPTKATGGVAGEFRKLNDFRQQVLHTIFNSAARKKVVAGPLFSHLLKARVPAEAANVWADAVRLSMSNKLSAKQLAELQKQSAAALLALLAVNTPQLTSSALKAVLQNLGARTLAPADRLEFQKVAARDGSAVSLSKLDAAAAPFELLESADANEAIRLWQGLQGVIERRELVQVSSRVAQILEGAQHADRLASAQQEATRLRRLVAMLAAELRRLEKNPVPWLSIDTARLVDAVEIASPKRLPESPAEASETTESATQVGNTDFAMLVQQLSQTALVGGAARSSVERALIEQLPTELNEARLRVEQYAADSPYFFEVLCSFVATNKSELGSSTLEELVANDGPKRAVWKHVAIRDAHKSHKPFGLSEKLADPVVDEVAARVHEYVRSAATETTAWAAERVQNEVSSTLAVVQRETVAAGEFITQIVNMIEEAQEHVTSRRN
ncbi:MAG: hypothetical protein WD771_05070 [Gemmatimonadaceae bacterium]